MGKVILYLEDEAAMRRHTAELLRKEGYSVKDFRRIDQGKEYFLENYDEIACVITDLNMADEFLGKYRGESDGGYVTGWVFLQRFVYVKKPCMPTIIYSGYIPDLEEYLQERNEKSLLGKENVVCVRKGISKNGDFPELIRALKKLHIEGANGDE